VRNGLARTSIPSAAPYSGEEPATIGVRGFMMPRPLRMPDGRPFGTRSLTAMRSVRVRS
jgi:hypothetical protein